MDTRGILERRMVWGALLLPLPPLQHLSRWWCRPDLPKVRKRRLNNVLLFLRLKSQLGKVVGTLCSRLLLVFSWMRVFWEGSGRKFLAHLLLRRKKRHLADLRHKRDKAQRVLDRLVEDAEKKRMLYEEACAKVNSQREELDVFVRQVDAARVQVNLPTPPPTLPSDDGDWDQGEESGVEGSEDEARREVEAGLGMDVDSSCGNVVGHVGEADLLRLRFMPLVEAAVGPSRLPNLLPRPHRNWTLSVLDSWQL